MGARSNIEWTDMKWNPATACVKISKGCTHCYAERMAKRLKAMGSSRYLDGFKPTLHHDLIDLPLRWKKPRTVFVNSMNDLFQKAVPDDFIARVFETMAAYLRHTFQILTKRSDRVAALGHRLLVERCLRDHSAGQPEKAWGWLRRGEVCLLR